MYRHVASSYSCALLSSKKQTSLISQLEDENRRFTNVETLEDLQQMVFSHSCFSKFATHYETVSRGAVDANPVCMVFDLSLLPFRVYKMACLHCYRAPVKTVVCINQLENH